MSFETDIKQLRINQEMTQQELADRMHVSRQTVSTWETGKNYPNLEIMRELSLLFGVSFEKLVFGEETMKKENTVAEKVDLDLKKKGRYKKVLMGIGSLAAVLMVLGGVLFYGYEKGIDFIDRTNPFLSYTIGVAELPSDNEVNPNNKNHGRWTAWFSDDDWGDKWTKLTLSTGINPGTNKPYVMAYHKGSYVKRARIVPESAVNSMRKANVQTIKELADGKWDEDAKASGAPKDLLTSKDLKQKKHLNDSIMTMPQD
ncbi:helix-turn-helix transcriptional regulator [Fructobacillus sp. M2-14]|uniref:Helix-turn-helix transcriptional regulator n=1 Tax=Fructobacillus broussonetiae TaxID=2713173 RepID=A0ABS5QZW0_9LACO|nr:helix-turn-helix transcriptional regulator [Fructobacillus broussonetiae]MBS9338743.1 helix-turn-helix transcriptional regulator [Fructobacillus broussonetiae]